jgi:hypothetical protein
MSPSPFSWLPIPGLVIGFERRPRAYQCHHCRECYPAGTVVQALGQKVIHEEALWTGEVEVELLKYDGY